MTLLKAARLLRRAPYTTGFGNTATVCVPGGRQLNGGIDPLIEEPTQPGVVA